MSFEYGEYPGAIAFAAAGVIKVSQGLFNLVEKAGKFLSDGTAAEKIMVVTAAVNLITAAVKTWSPEVGMAIDGLTDTFIQAGAQPEILQPIREGLQATLTNDHSMTYNLLVTSAFGAAVSGDLAIKAISSNNPDASSGNIFDTIGDMVPEAAKVVWRNPTTSFALMPAFFAAGKIYEDGLDANLTKIGLDFGVIGLAVGTTVYAGRQALRVHSGKIIPEQATDGVVNGLGASSNFALSVSGFTSSLPLLGVAQVIFTVTTGITNPMEARARERRSAESSANTPSAP